MTLALLIPLDCMLQHLLTCYFFSHHFIDNQAILEDEDAVGDRQEFVQLTGYDQYGMSFVRQLADDMYDLCLGADIHTDGGFIKHQDAGLPAIWR